LKNDQKPNQKHEKKLTLSSETIRVLSDASLDAVRGGGSDGRALMRNTNGVFTCGSEQAQCMPAPPGRRQNLY
jgi:hypothetical protein